MELWGLIPRRAKMKFSDSYYSFFFIFIVYTYVLGLFFPHTFFSHSWQKWFQKGGVKKYEKGFYENVLLY